MTETDEKGGDAPAAETGEAADHHGGGDHHHEQGPGWATSPGFVRAFTFALYAACALAAVAGFIWPKDHPHFAVERFPVFFALYGFVMFALIVLLGQHLRKLVGRSPTYYEERE